MGEQTMRALTIKQIKNCDIPQDGVFRVDGADVTQVNRVHKRVIYVVIAKVGSGIVDLYWYYSWSSRVSYQLCIYY